MCGKVSENSGGREGEKRKKRKKKKRAKTLLAAANLRGGVNIVSAVTDWGKKREPAQSVGSHPDHISRGVYPESISNMLLLCTTTAGPPLTRRTE